MGCDLVEYTQINNNHSVGQEIEYCLQDQEGNISKPEDNSAVIKGVCREFKLEYKRNSAKAYEDGGQIELCSSPHADISSLYRQMKDMHDAMVFFAAKRGLKPASSAFVENVVTFGSNHRVLYASSHVHIGAPKLYREPLLRALAPYLPVFIAIANNSPDFQYPHGSKRLRRGCFGNKLSFAKGMAARPPKAIYLHDKAPTVEVRCMDRAKAIEEDIANAAFVFAAAERIKREMPLLQLMLRPMQRSFAEIYGAICKKEEGIGELIGSMIWVANAGLGELVNSMMWDASCHGLNMPFYLKGKGFALKDIARDLYKDICGILIELNTPKELMGVLERKLL